MYISQTFQSWCTSGIQIPGSVIMKAMNFFTRKPGEVKENRSKDTQGTQQTEESLAWLRLFGKVGCGSAYNHVFLNAVAQHLIHMQGKEKADPWRQHVHFLLQAIPSHESKPFYNASPQWAGVPLQSTTVKPAVKIHRWFGKEILLPRPFSQLVWSVNPSPDLMDLNYLQLPPLCTTTQSADTPCCSCRKSSKFY